MQESPCPPHIPRLDLVKVSNDGSYSYRVKTFSFKFKYLLFGIDFAR